MVKKIQSFQEAKSFLKEAGLKATPSRVAVLRVLSEINQPMSHGQIALLLEEFDKTTIFRNLNDLAENGLIERMDLGDRLWRFEAKSLKKQKADLHPHFICIACGKILCLSTNEIEAINKIAQKVNKIKEISQILLKGSCIECEA